MRLMSLLVTFLTLLSLNTPLLAQSSTERWVGTWATALVARGLPPAPAPAPAPPPSGLTAPAPPAGGAPGGGGRLGGPPVTVSNQTLRQIVRTSIGGSRVRVVLSNVFGTTPLAIGAADVAPRARDVGRGRGLGEAADLRRLADGDDPRRRGPRQRRGRDVRRAALGPGRRPLSAGRSRHRSVARHDRTTARRRPTTCRRPATTPARPRCRCPRAPAPGSCWRASR